MNIQYLPLVVAVVWLDEMSIINISAPYSQGTMT